MNFQAAVSIFIVSIGAMSILFVVVESLTRRKPPKRLRIVVGMDAKPTRDATRGSIQTFRDLERR